MGIGLFIILRILFVTCMIFIIGYIFGGFSKKVSLTRISKVAAILIIVLFIASNFLAFRSRFGHCQGDHWRQRGWDSSQREERRPAN